MKLFNLRRVSLLLIVSLVLMLSYANTAVGARADSSFGQRRLLNLSGNSLQPTELTEVPTALIIEPGNKLVQYYKAVGFQEYVFTGTWKLVNASATLSSLAGEEVAEHYYLPHKDAFGGQPTWRSFSPESLVTGSSLQTVTVSPTSIRWMVLKSTQTSGSPSRFGAVTYVQRLFTSSGLPPDSSVQAQLGDISKTPYTATYVFYAKG